jgi:hypothetical protein
MKNKENEKKGGDETGFMGFTRIDSGHTNAHYLSPTTVIGLQNSITALNNFSAGLNVSMHEGVFAKNFSSVLEGQREALTIATRATERLTTYIPSVLGAVESMSGALTNIGLAANNTAKLYNSGVVDERYFKIINGISDTALSIVNDQQGILSGKMLSITGNNFTLRDSAVFAPSAHIVSSGVEHMMRALPTYPSEIILTRVLDIEAPAEVKQKKLPEYQEKLDLMLKKISPDLVESRQGAWDTFERKGKDYIRQSSSSMRGMVDELLHTMAPDDKVKNTEFYNTEHGNVKGKPTRKARLRYIMKMEEKNQEHLKRLAHSIDSFLQVYDNLSAWDHVPLKQDEFVYGAFIAIEGLLVSLLSENN